LDSIARYSFRHIFRLRRVQNKRISHDVSLWWSCHNPPHDPCSLDAQRISHTFNRLFVSGIDWLIDSCFLLHLESKKSAIWSNLKRTGEAPDHNSMKSPVRQFLYHMPDEDQTCVKYFERDSLISALSSCSNKSSGDLFQETVCRFSNKSFADFQRESMCSFASIIIFQIYSNNEFAEWRPCEILFDLWFGIDFSLKTVPDKSTLPCFFWLFVKGDRWISLILWRRFI